MGKEMSLNDIDVESIMPVDTTDKRVKHKQWPYFPKKGIALSLSGGGYRAMLFHLGSLLRLNELGYLKKLDRISSVSGGSITAAVLARHWNKLKFDKAGVGQRFAEEVVEPIRNYASRTVDLGAIFKGFFTPNSRANRLICAYRKYLYGRVTLKDLPDKPYFVFNAANIQSGVLWRFMKKYMADYRVGTFESHGIELASAVAASSAWPPLLSPFRLKLKESDCIPPDPNATWKPDLDYKNFTTDVLLTDGGVYDNLGIETTWKKYDEILISDAGGMLKPNDNPGNNLISHLLRVVTFVDNQVRSLRKRQSIRSFKLRGVMLNKKMSQKDPLFRLATRKGAYWGISTDIADYFKGDPQGHPIDPLPCPVRYTTELADIMTRFGRLNSKTQERLINWGYAVCDAAMRKYVDTTLPAPDGFPYLGGVVE